MNSKVALSVLAIVTTVAAAVAIWMWALSGYRSPSHVAAQTATADTADQALLDNMRKAGSDLSKPVQIDHYLYVPRKDLADQAAAELRPQGYKVTVDTAAVVRPGEAWVVLASQTAVPTIDYLRRTRATFTALANKLGGAYDGWEAPVAK